MQFQAKQKSHKNSNLRTIFLKIFKKATLPTALLCLFFLSLPTHIKAQIASIISEDGDGIIGITSLMNAAINDDVSAVQFFAKSGVAVVNQKNVGGASALHIAARRGNIEICKILLENGANINITDNEGWTPLMRAALAKNSDLVRMLLLRGADPKKMNSVGESVIINAASSECSSCLEQLFSGYDFINNINIDVLKKQLDEAMTIANNKNDLASQAIIREYLNSEVNKSKIYSLTNNRSIEMPITPNNNHGDGVVTVKSLDDMRSGNKPAYKFLPSKTSAVQQLPEQQSSPLLVPQKNFNKVYDNDINKSDHKVDDSNVPALDRRLFNTRYKKFIFKGDKKPFTILKFNNQSSPNIQPKTELNKIESKSTELNHNTLDEVKHDGYNKTGNTNSTVKYKFLGQAKPFIANKK